MKNLMVNRMNAQLQNELYFYFFSWGFYFSAGYFAFKNLYELFTMRLKENLGCKLQTA